MKYLSIVFTSTATDHTFPFKRFSAALLCSLCLVILGGSIGHHDTSNAVAANLYSNHCAVLPFDRDFPKPVVNTTVLFLRTKLARPFVLALPPHKSSWVTRHVSSSGMWAPVETSIFYHILTHYSATRRGIVVDVNVGYFSMLAHSMGFTVIGFEPQRRALPLLTLTAVVNGAQHRNFHLFPCAVGQKEGHVTMTEDADTEWGIAKVAQTSDGQTPIPVAVLSRMITSNVVLLKVDTEGFESNVFAGAWDLMGSHNVENIVVEIKEKSVRLGLKNKLESMGYVCRQYAEKYGSFVETMIPMPYPKNAMQPCNPTGDGPEDFWFSKSMHGIS